MEANSSLKIGMVSIYVDSPKRPLNSNQKEIYKAGLPAIVLSTENKLQPKIS